MENQIQPSGFVIQPRLQFKHLRDRMIYSYLIEEADYTDNVGKMKLNLSEMSKETGWTRDMIYSSLNRLKQAGYIKTETMYQKQGILVEIVDYDWFQKLENYKKNGEKNPQGIHKKHTSNPQGKESANPDLSRGDNMEEIGNPQANHKKHASNPKITEFLLILVNNINSNNNINIKNITSIIDEAEVKNNNLSSKQDIEIFVDFALQINALPSGTSRKVLISYFDCIRLTRQTCTISAKILAKFIEKISKYSVNQIHYALWTHVEKHDDKRENYTLGILRNTDEHEARRGLIKLKNKGGVIDRAVGEENYKYDYGF
ncbi:hypothetical protein B4065_0130 [Caldibacillus thermoamylovorans]|uniref:hypothetical protein n=1 Tax=Bacillaceae TaxID=186817 RepID=UPI0005A48601|nr:hypothetical protein [Caldibacillus thermoamylovorans]KIO60204.1 hypothetical protein B4065_0130 [Caldibacillus thermoamylovorans]